MIVAAAFEAPTVIAGLNDVAVMGQPVQQRRSHLGIAEQAWPFSECEVSGDDDGGALVEPADEVEQELAAGLGKREVTEFVQDDEVHPSQMLSYPALPPIAGLGLEPVDEVDHVVEPAACARSDTASGNGDGEVALAGAGPANPSR